MRTLTDRDLARAIVKAGQNPTFTSRSARATYTNTLYDMALQATRQKLPHTVLISALYTYSLKDYRISY